MYTKTYTWDTGGGTPSDLVDAVLQGTPSATFSPQMWAHGLFQIVDRYGPALARLDGFRPLFEFYTVTDDEKTQRSIQPGAVKGSVPDLNPGTLCLLLKEVTTSLSESESADDKRQYIDTTYLLLTQTGMFVWCRLGYRLTILDVPEDADIRFLEHVTFFVSNPLDERSLTETLYGYDCNTDNPLRPLGAFLVRRLVELAEKTERRLMREAEQATEDLRTLEGLATKLGIR